MDFATSEPVETPFDIQQIFLANSEGEKLCSFLNSLVPEVSRRDRIIHTIYSNVLIEDRGYKDEHGNPSCCYIWQGGSTGQNGRGANYPKWSLDGQKVRVHRVVFCHFEGYIHAKRHVDHRCRTRMCVRYEHLRSVTHKQNMLFRDIDNGVVRKPKRRKRRK